ncbi:GMC oxidoreductase [Loktanella sp. S4079]|uniref:GMC oxidoreductase n=1 Tax=Loktanella sp. S4079 TaxID=579483 RepID=UPI00061F6F22|nr:GMC family oxidoreductase [Loktanella sp. S4079]KJZ18630.1 hypothetical protein TW80_14625 [Loktanella sp. S4079]
MPIIDLQTAAQRDYDACVVGSGPAGIAVALTMSENGRSVLLIDAGGEQPTAGPSAERSVPSAHSPLNETNCRAFGGTSWLWGGRILPFSKPEFERDAWPISYDELAAHHDAAAIFLGGSAFDTSVADENDSSSFDLNAIETLGTDGPVSRRHAGRLQALTGPDILLSTVVVGLLMQTQEGSDPNCIGVRACPTQQTHAPIALHARVTIIASGGVETARLLLADQARNPNIFGHLTELGRGYSGHLTGSIAHITFPKNTDSRVFGWRTAPDGGFRRRVFRTSKRGVMDGMNMFFWAKNHPEEDARHGSGILSAKYLKSRLLGRKTLVSAAGLGAPEKPTPTSIMSHLSNLLGDLPTTLRALPDLLRGRRHPDRRQLDHLIPNRANWFKLCYHADQTRNLSNRITLSGNVDDDSLPEIKIAYDFSDIDIQNVINGHKNLETVLDQSGVAKLTFDFAPEQLHNAVRGKARDGYHQLGTARMGRDATESVVDGNCKMHGIAGLYIAGSSVFRSAGSAPPTHTIVALAMRLAHHICGQDAPRQQRLH